MRQMQESNAESTNGSPDKLAGLMRNLAMTSPEVVSAARKGSNLGLDEPLVNSPVPLTKNMENQLKDAVNDQVLKSRETVKLTDSYIRTRIPCASSKHTTPKSIYDNSQVDKQKQLKNAARRKNSLLTPDESKNLDYLKQMMEDEIDKTCVVWGIGGGFTFSRATCEMLDMLSFKSRKQVFTLNKTERLLRELKNLDGREARETHKVAIIYVARGNEDKYSILSQQEASLDFESFVSTLGWEVGLNQHPGYKGKIRMNECGQSAPYYCNSSCEVIFHVTTRFPTPDGESVVQEDALWKEQITMKLRHIGNDEIHIVWSEHWRDYRRGIIPTEFGDVVIVIYPTSYDGLYKIQIIKKPEIPEFGPLYDGALVERCVLGELVRETAIQAGRARRASLTGYRQHFEERSHYLEQLIKNYKEHATFEQFSAEVFAPVQKGVLDGYQNRGKHSMSGFRNDCLSLRFSLS